MGGRGVGERVGDQKREGRGGKGGGKEGLVFRSYKYYLRKEGGLLLRFDGIDSILEGRGKWRINSINIILWYLGRDEGRFRVLIILILQYNIIVYWEHRRRAYTDNSIGLPVRSLRSCCIRSLWCWCIDVMVDSLLIQQQISYRHTVTAGNAADT